MFCEKCGTELSNDAVFCEKCGNKVGGGSNEKTIKEPDNTVLLELKPVYKFMYKMLPSVILWLIVFLIFVLPLSTIGGGLEEDSFIVAVPIVFIAIVFVILLIKYLINKKQYSCYDYDFYRTKIIYKDGFLNIAEKEVKYKYIREIVMRQSFIQRLFNLGTITLFTNAESGYANGIHIIDLENVTENYKRVKEIINI